MQYYKISTYSQTTKESEAVTIADILGRLDFTSHMRAPAGKQLFHFTKHYAARAQTILDLHLLNMSGGFSRPMFDATMFASYIKIPFKSGYVDAHLNKSQLDKLFNRWLAADVFREV